MESVSDNPKWWRPVWICLAGAQTLPNVSPLTVYPPRKIYFLHTSDEQSIISARRCKQFFEERAIETRLCSCAPYNMASIQSVVASIICEEGEDWTLINWTGGSKPMAVASLAAARNATNLYFNSNEGLIVNGEGIDRSFLKKIPSFSVMDIIKLNAEVESIQHAPECTVEAPNTALVLEQQLDKELAGRGYPKLLLLLQEFRSGHKKAFEKYSCEFKSEMAAAMQKDRLCSTQGLIGINNNGKRFLSGAWWECYVRSKIIQFFKNRKMHDSLKSLETNINVVWNSNDNNFNEIDLAFLVRDRLFLISCGTGKHTNIEKHRLQIERFADHLGGTFARPMLACALKEDAIRKIATKKSHRLFMPNLKLWQNPDSLLETWMS